MKNIIQLVVLTLALTVGVFAQFEPTEPIDPTVISFVGDQSVAGTFVDATQKVEGNSFVMNGCTKVYASTLLTIAFDYYGTPEYSAGNEITGGLWNLGVYSKGGEYKGSIYGVVTNGNIAWSVFEGRRGRRAVVGSTRTTKAFLKVVGGTGDFYNIVSSEVTFNGETDLQTNATTGTLEGLEF
jgi:hypothetical protein